MHAKRTFGTYPRRRPRCGCTADVGGSLRWRRPRPERGKRRPVIYIPRPTATPTAVRLTESFIY